LGADLTGYTGNRPSGPVELRISRVDTMSVDIAAVLREEAKTARAIAGRLTDTHDKAVLQQLAAKLVEIAERLERDARD
jgi:hypothetical protein